MIVHVGEGIGRPRCTDSSRTRKAAEKRRSERRGVGRPPGLLGWRLTWDRKEGPATMEGTMGHGSLGHQPDHCGNDLGFSMVATALGLGATAILTVILLTTMFKSGTSSNASVSNAPGVAEATSLQARQTLSSGLSTVEAAAASAGGYGSLTPSTLSASGASASFVAGPSSNATTISIAVSEAGGAAIGGGESGSVTLAARASDSVCWLIWKSAEGRRGTAPKQV